MKLAIKKIEYISVKNVKSWSHLGRNDSINVENFKSGEFSDISFTELTASLEEEWLESSAGEFSQSSLTATIRTNKDQARRTLSYLLSNKSIFRITDMSGEKYLIGSIDFIPKMLFKFQVTGMTTSEIQLSITCKSKIGIILDTCS